MRSPSSLRAFWPALTTGTSFSSRKELMAHINAFVAAYNVDAKPFVWTKSEVHQKRLKPCFADQ